MCVVMIDAWLAGGKGTSGWDGAGRAGKRDKVSAIGEAGAAYDFNSFVVCGGFAIGG